MSKTLTEKTAATGESVSKKVLWLVLLVAWLGWMFDGMEMGLYSVLARPALKDLLHTTVDKAIGPYVGIMFALFLLGASLGGFIFGRLGDKIGRVKTMIITVILYAVFTLLTAITRSAFQFGACRFLGAMGMGGEWGLGVALVMETWPNAKRPVLAGILGSSANVGFLVSSLINLQFGNLGWRLIFCAGIVPALLTLVIRMSIREPERWVKARERGERPDLRQLLDPTLRRNTVLACLISSVAVIGTWGVFQWIPTWVGSMVSKEVVAKTVALTAMYMAFGQIVGAFIGGPVAEWIGRRISYALFSVGSLATAIPLWLTVHSFGPQLIVLAMLAGVFTTAFFGWLPLYLPELFPTRIRATGEGITFNFGRIIAAVGVFQTGAMVAAFGGSYAKAGATMSLIYVIGLVLIWFLPETKGCKLPE
jgi:MFS transporter, SHS family, sialic acid transporter